MIAILTLLTVIALSLVVTRIAAVALTHTGLSEESARFQARSAFSGVGFATREAENVMNHPVRRRIIMQLMLLGNAGLVTAVSSVVLTAMDLSGPQGTPLAFMILGGGVAVLFAAGKSRWVDQQLSKFINWALRRYTDIDVQDYVSLLHLGEYRIKELTVGEDFWFAGQTLQAAQLKRRYGVQILGITRKNGTFLGTPSGGDTLEPGDRLIVYCPEGSLRGIDWGKPPDDAEASLA